MIKLLVFDVDGCMTSGEITYSNSGDEYKSFDVKDGLAIVSWMMLGLKTAIITGRESKIVEKRAKELGINYIFQGVRGKEEKLKEILAKENLNFQDVAAIGDDINDNKMLKLVGWSFTPNNGSHFTKDIVDTILSKNGGNGALREMIEIILEKENKTKEFLELWQ